jgi:chromosomal replication initiator protein
MRTSPVIKFTTFLKQKHQIIIDEKIINDYLKPKEKVEPYFKADPYSLEIIKIVSDFFNVSSDDLIGKSRKKVLSVPRQIAIYFIEKNCWISMELIGKIFSDRDHSTVTASIKKVKGFIETDKNYAEKIKILEDKIK